MKFNIAYLTGVAVFTAIFFASSVAHAQQAQRADSIHKVVAGPEYNRSPLHNALWGQHYRKEWSTPVSVASFYLDTAKGGLIPYEKGGSRQTMSLKLHD